MKISKSSLERIFGEENVLIGEEALAAYCCDASTLEKKPLAIVFPQDADQVHKLILFANRSKLRLTPRGAGTGLAGAATPSEDSVVVDMSRMNRIITVDTSKKMAIVEPGVIVDDLNEVLLEYGLMFPVIPASHEACQIGGMISTNAAGMRAIKYGKMSNWVMELEFIDGTGKSYVMKDPSDVIGSEGTLGIITKAKLMLVEPVKKCSLSVEKFGEEKDAVERARKIREKDNIIALEYMDKVASDLVGFGKNHTLFIEYEDIDGISEGSVKNLSEIEELTTKRESLGPKLTSEGYVIMEDPKVPIDGMEKFLTWLSEKNIPSFGHIGIGIIHPRFKPGQEKLIAEMVRLVEKLHGQVSGEHGYGLSKKEHVPAEVKTEIRGLKHKYDPHGLFNKGKII